MRKTIENLRTSSCIFIYIFFLLFICGFSSHVDSIRLDEIGLTITLPKGVVTVGQKTDADDSVFSDIRMTPERFKKTLAMQGAQYAIFTQGYDYEYYLLADLDEKAQNVTNLSDFSDTDMDKFYHSIQQDVRDVAFSEDYAVKNIAGITYIIYDLDVESIKYRKYASVVNGYFYSLQIYGGSDGISDTECELAEKILSGVKFDHIDPTPREMRQYRVTRIVFCLIALLCCVALWILLFLRRKSCETGRKEVY